MRGANPPAQCVAAELVAEAGQRGRRIRIRAGTWLAVIMLPAAPRRALSSYHRGLRYKFGARYCGTTAVGIRRARFPMLRQPCGWELDVEVAMRYWDWRDEIDQAECDVTDAAWYFFSHSVRIRPVIHACGKRSRCCPAKRDREEGKPR